MIGTLFFENKISIISDYHGRAMLFLHFGWIISYASLVINGYLLL
jgi:hypothetical protein